MPRICEFSRFPARWIKNFNPSLTVLGATSALSATISLAGITPRCTSADANWRTR